MTDEELKIQAMIRFWKELSSSEQQLKMCEGCQIRWERDEAMKQLEEHHIPFMCVAEDVVEVVRCGDCEYWKQIDPYFGECLRLPGEMVIAENWFCADGERKEDGQTDS